MGWTVLRDWWDFAKPFSLNHPACLPENTKLILSLCLYYNFLFKVRRLGTGYIILGLALVQVWLIITLGILRIKLERGLKCSSVLWVVLSNFAPESFSSYQIVTFPNSRVFLEWCRLCMSTWPQTGRAAYGHLPCGSHSRMSFRWRWWLWWWRPRWKYSRLICPLPIPGLTATTIIHDDDCDDD